MFAIWNFEIRMNLSEFVRAYCWVRLHIYFKKFSKSWWLDIVTLRWAEFCWSWRRCLWQLPLASSRIVQTEEREGIIRCQFHQHSTSSFDTPRSWKRKNTQMAWLPLCTFGICRQFHQCFMRTLFVQNVGAKNYKAVFLSKHN